MKNSTTVQLSEKKQMDKKSASQKTLKNDSDTFLKKKAAECKRQNSYPSALELEKFIRELDPNVIIFQMKCAVGPFKRKSFIAARLYKPDFCEDGELADYHMGHIFMEWDSNGAMIKSDIHMPWLNKESRLDIEKILDSYST